MITEDYCSFEIAKLLKEKGFPQEYDMYNSMVYNEKDYEDEYEVQRMVLETKLVKAGTLSSYPVSVPEPKCYCPTHQMAMKWLRKKGFHIYTFHIKLWNFEIQNLNEDWTYSKPGYKSHEEAVEAAIKYCLENLI